MVTAQFDTNYAGNLGVAYNMRLIFAGIAMPQCDYGFGVNIIMGGHTLDSQLLTMNTWNSINSQTIGFKAANL